MNPDVAVPSWTAEVTGELHRNPWFGVLQQRVTLPDGAPATYYTLDFPSPAVGIVARDGDRYLLIYQYRFIIDRFVWAIPSGGVQEGEELAVAAARELAEETGYAAGSITHVLSYFPSYGCSNQRFELFLAERLTPTTAEFDRNEVIRTQWFSRADLLEMVTSNGILDGLSLTPLLLLLLREHL